MNEVRFRVFLNSLSEYTKSLSQYWKLSFRIPQMSTLLQTIVEKLLLFIKQGHGL